jgi:hypothetical protein
MLCEFPERVDTFVAVLTALGYLVGNLHGRWTAKGPER